jgi:predicted HicB family RNase H-like nuclease
MSKGNYSFRLTYSEEDECYLATIPEFKGVVGHGDTRQEALQEAEVSLQAALEVYEAKTWPLPEPEQQHEYSGQFRLRVPRSLHAKLASQAALEGVSLNTYAITLLSQNNEGAKREQNCLKIFKKNCVLCLTK